MIIYALIWYNREFYANFTRCSLETLEIAGDLETWRSCQGDHARETWRRKKSSIAAALIVIA